MLCFLSYNVLDTMYLHQIIDNRGKKHNERSKCRKYHTNRPGEKYKKVTL